MKKIPSILALIIMSIVIGASFAAHIDINPIIPIGVVAAGLFTVALNPVEQALGATMTDLRKSSRNNMGGLQVILYYGLYDDVNTWPTLPDQEASATAMDALAVLTGNLTMKAGKRMFELYATLGEIELKNTMVGPLDGQCFKHELSIKHPGLAAKLLGFQAATNNENLFFIFKRHNGDAFMMGLSGMPVMKNKDDGGTGKKIEDGSFTEMTFESYGPTPAPKFTGTIPLTVATSGSGA